MKLRLLLALLLLVVSACSESSPATTTTMASPVEVAPDAFPVTVDGIEIDERPDRIASLSATHTEILYAIGAGERVVATDLFSNYPAEAEATEKIDSFNLNVEAVAAIDPDLVILAFDPGGVIDGLAELDIPVLLFDAPADLEGALDQFIAVGEAVGERDAASELAPRTSEEIIALYGAYQGGSATYYWELDPTPFSLTSQTFFGQLLAPLGLENIADEADEAGFGYLQLSPEYIIDANPDVVFLADTLFSGQTAETLSARPGWADVAAIRDGRVVELNDDVASRWGPRIVDLLREIVEALQ